MMFFRYFHIFLLLSTFCFSFSVGAEPISVVAVGDLLLGGSAADTVKRYGFTYPFVSTQNHIEQADIALANLEAPLTSRGEKHPDKKYTFRVPPAAAKDLKQVGFDLMTLANNHIGDYGDQGIIDTLEALEKNNLGIAGAGRDLEQARRPHIVEIDGKRLAFLAFSNTFPESFYARKNKPGTVFGDFDRVAADIRKARKENDYVIVSFHWGGERMNDPKDYQMALGRLAIDHGAQVVIGHHPHVLQGAEIYQDGVIYYSLGNYAFGSYSQSAVTAGLARVWFDDGSLKKAEILPLNVLNIDVRFQPKPLSHGPAFAFAREFNDFSEPLNTRLRRQPGLFWGIEKIETAEDQLQADLQGTEENRKDDKEL